MSSTNSSFQSFGIWNSGVQYLVELIGWKGKGRTDRRLSSRAGKTPFQPTVVAADRGRQFGILFPNPAQKLDAGQAGHLGVDQQGVEEARIEMKRSPPSPSASLSTRGLSAPATAPAV